MHCKHEQSMLVGSAAGITCRACGKTFPTYAALMAEKSAPTVQETPETGNSTPAPEVPAETQETPEEKKRGRKKKDAAQE